MPTVLFHVDSYRIHVGKGPLRILLMKPLPRSPAQQLLMWLPPLALGTCVRLYWLCLTRAVVLRRPACRQLFSPYSLLLHRWTYIVQV